VTFTAETLSIDLVNILRAGRPRGKPSFLGNHLDSTERKTVPRSSGKLRAYWLAGPEIKCRGEGADGGGGCIACDRNEEEECFALAAISRRTVPNGR
jgi:hypothetical protein